ncbi:MAG: hypothetical protein JXK93_11880, partial [Sphaerochaetaceae bacterium]|nr:hypothetical protein [Sphaerochaetaceae bacterium]
FVTHLNSINILHHERLKGKIIFFSCKVLGALNMGRNTGYLRHKGTVVVVDVEEEKKRKIFNILYNRKLYTDNVKMVHKKSVMQVLYETAKDIAWLKPSLFTQRAEARKKMILDFPIGEA